MKLPASGRDWDAVEKGLKEIAEADPKDEYGRLTMYALQGTEDVQRVARNAYNMFFPRNQLFERALGGLGGMAKDVCEMSVDILGGGSDAVASITAGGSESIFNALHAARARARKMQPQIIRPNVVVPYSIHATFGKSCHYLGLELRRVPVRSDYRADVALMEAMIDDNTIAIAGSAPSWPYGLFDPIAELGQMAIRHDLWLHVDACVGGFLAPFVKALGYNIPDFGLNVPGVLSISADVHKYGYGAKPCSIIAYNSTELFSYQHVAISDWPCGTYRTGGVLGSRPAGAVASAWAVMHYLGREGYLALAARTMQVKSKLVSGINEIAGLRAWENELALLLFESEFDDLEQISASMLERGWLMMGVNQPKLISLTVDPVDDVWVEKWLGDLRLSVSEVRAGRSNKTGSLDYV